MESRCLLAVAVTSPNEALAQQAAQLSYEGSSLTGENGPTAKIGPDLTLAYEEQRLIPQVQGQAFKPSNPLLELQGDSVSVDIVASGSVATLKSDVAALGMQVTGTVGSLITGLIPIDSLASLAALSSVNFARPDYKPITNVGLVTSQGDQTLQSALARSTYDVDGTGITIGIISDSFNTSGNGSYAADVASGDLPNNVDIISDEADGTDEGRAMAQIVHDVAPGASIDFAAAGDSDESMAQSIQALAAAGANIIVDDVGFLDEPVFQDGVIAQAAEAAVNSGITYVSAAGNDGTNSYDSPFRASGQTAPDGGMLQNFDTGTGVKTLQEISVPADIDAPIMLQWDQPFKSLGGAGATSDLNITVFAADKSTVVAQGNANTIGGDPLQVVDVQNSGATTEDFYVQIELKSGPAPTQLKYILFDPGQIVDSDPGTDASTSYGHPDAAGVIGVAASAYYMDPAFGTTPPEVDNYSSLGGTPILFDTSGNLLTTPIIRDDPAVTGTDGVNTSFFGDYDDPIPDVNSFPNFFGTSAAAPHVAAIAALMLQAAGGPGKLTPAKIKQVLESTAIDITSSNDPTNFPGGLAQLPNSTGYDYYSGAGLVNADAAVGAVVAAIGATPALSIDNVSLPESATNTNFVFTVTLSSTSTQTVTVAYATQDGTATVANNNYTATSGTLTFAPGTTSETITVVALGNSVSEPDETFLVNLTNPVNATVTVAQGVGTILHVNQPPVAVDDSAQTVEGQSVAIPVAANDYDPDGTLDLTSVTIVTNASNGTTSVNPTTGVVTYTPNAGFTGNDQFTYTIKDNDGATSNVATVSITVIKPAPIALDDLGVTAINTPVTVDVLANDISDSSGIDPTSVKIVTEPDNGTASVNSDGTILYTPATGFQGADELTYTVNDHAGVTSNAATLVLYVGAEGSISGYSYVDLNNNGIKDPGEVGIPGVTVTLTKTDGNYTYSLSQQTDANGFYDFTDLVQGTYSISELHPAFFVQGQITPGVPLPTVAPVANTDVFSGIELPAGTTAASYNFGELGLRADFISAYLERRAFFASSDTTLGGIDLGQGDVMLAFDAGVQGQLFVSAQLGPDSSGATLTLYDNNMNPVATAVAKDGQVQLNFTGSSSSPYFLRVSGTGTLVDLQSDITPTVFDAPVPAAPAPTTPSQIWHNSANPFDVNNDGAVTPTDALILINTLNSDGIGAVSRLVGQSSYFLDVNNDGMLSPADVLAVINQLDLSTSATNAQSAVRDVRPTASPVAAAATDQAITQITASDGPFLASSLLPAESTSSTSSAQPVTSTNPASQTSTTGAGTLLNRSSFSAGSAAAGSDLDVTPPDTL